MGNKVRISEESGDNTGGRDGIGLGAGCAQFAVRRVERSNRTVGTADKAVIGPVGKSGSYGYARIVNPTGKAKRRV